MLINLNNHSQFKVNRLALLGCVLLLTLIASVLYMQIHAYSRNPLVVTAENYVMNMSQLLIDHKDTRAALKPVIWTGSEDFETAMKESGDLFKLNRLTYNQLHHSCITVAGDDWQNKYIVLEPETFVSVRVIPITCAQDTNAANNVVFTINIGKKSDGSYWILPSFYTNTPTNQALDADIKPSGASGVTIGHYTISSAKIVNYNGKLLIGVKWSLASMDQYFDSYTLAFANSSQATGLMYRLGNADFPPSEALNFLPTTDNLSNRVVFDTQSQSTINYAQISGVSWFQLNPGASDTLPHDQDGKLYVALLLTAYTGGHKTQLAQPYINVPLDPSSVYLMDIAAGKVSGNSTNINKFLSVSKPDVVSTATNETLVYSFTFDTTSMMTGDVLNVNWNAFNLMVGSQPPYALQTSIDSKTPGVYPLSAGITASGTLTFSKPASNQTYQLVYRYVEGVGYITCQVYPPPTPGQVCVHS